MLRDLTIQNYRAFNDFTIDGLARVNLIVGANNSGKTSFLEAVYLLVNHASLAALIEILDNREEFVIDVSPNTLQGSIRYQVAHIFHEHELGVRKDTKIQLRTSKDTQLGAYLRIRPRAAAV